MLNKIIVAPDSFKGTLSARKAANIIASEILAINPNIAVVKIPIADGGEGSVEAIISAIGGRTEETCVLSPDNRKIPAVFGITQKGQAVLELAQSSGLTRQIGLHPMTSNTYGFGQLMLRALDLGLRDFLLCMGGSATTDGGCGMATALGVRFLDENKACFVPTGQSLKNILYIDLGTLDPRVHESSFKVLCDVDNPLYGSKGAAFVYGPQKGASREQVEALDCGLRHLGHLVFETLDTDFADIPGAGAAGGMGFGCCSFLGATLESGIDTVLKLYEFKRHLAGASLIITGEGKLDEQSFSGKALSGILRNAPGVPVVSICGVCSIDESYLSQHNLSVYALSEDASSVTSMSEPEKCLRAQVAKVLETFSQCPCWTC